MNILQEIAAYTTERIAAKKQEMPPDKLRAAAYELKRDTSFAFETALRGDDIAFICEIKKASPSKGLIAADFPYLEIARAYVAAGAAAISVLTEPKYFLGADAYLADIARTVSIPLLRKDFTIDEYMIYEAKLMGASAVLLICALLEGERLAEYIGIADDLGLSALVEVHDERQLECAVAAGARIIGVNNRDLRTFTVDLALSERLRPLVPRELLFVAESGIQTAADVARMRSIGADAVLIGEWAMRNAAP